MRRLIILLLAVAVLWGGLFCTPALATNADEGFVITGGTDEQRAIARDALEAASWDWGAWGGEPSRIMLTPSHPPYWGSGLATAGIDQIAFPSFWGVAYFPSQDIYIDSRLTDPSVLRQVVMHEAAHARVAFPWFYHRPAGGGIYDCYALEAWRELIGVYGDVNDWMQSPVESHAEWFRVTYLAPSLQANPVPLSALPEPPRGVLDVRAFHEEWCAPATEIPITWGDIPTDDEELMAAAYWSWNKGLLVGYPDGDFHPWDPVLERHVALVADRAGLPAPDWFELYGIATRGEVAAGIPGLQWREERFEEPLTRSQLLRLIYRSQEALDRDKAVAASLEAWFAETYVTWKGVTRQPQFLAHADLIVELARQTRIPIWLCLGMSWYESQWGTTGLSTRYNCAFGVKDVAGKWGSINGVVSGFADYTSTESMIRAWFALMEAVYLPYLERGDIDGLCERYAPSWENNHRTHVATVLKYKRLCEERRIR
jgi:hypothetical protein